MSADSIHAVRSAAAVLKDSSNVASASPDARASRGKGRKGAPGSAAVRASPAVRRPRAPATPAKAAGGRDSAVVPHAAKDGAAATPVKSSKKSESERGTGSPAVVRAPSTAATPRTRPEAVSTAVSSAHASPPAGTGTAAASLPAQNPRAVPVGARAAPSRQQHQQQQPHHAVLTAQAAALHPMLDPLAQLNPQALQQIVRQILLRSYRGPLAPALAAANIDAALAMGHSGGSSDPCASARTC